MSPPDAETRHAIIAAALAGRTYVQIAATFRVSKGAVAGIIYRAKRSPAPPEYCVPAQAQRTGPTPDAVPLLEVRPNQCRWPLWSAVTPFDDKFYCGVGIDPGRNYCPAHRRLAYTLPPLAKRRAA